MRIMKWLIQAVVLVPMLALAGAPDVSFQDLAGSPRYAREYIGRGLWTVVAVWSADCPICRREMFHMAFFHDEHKSKDATVLGLSIDGSDNLARARAFVRDQSLDFPNVIATADEASLLSGTAFIGTPTYYVFTPDGKFAAQRIGPMTQEQMESLLDRLKASPRRGE